MEIYFPQLEELGDRDAEIRDFIKQIADRMNALESAIATITAAPTPQPEQVQPELPLTEAPPETKKPRRTKATVKGNGEAAAPQHKDDDEDEEDLRARATFEARRTTRLYGIAGTRATIKRVAGPTVLNVDDVPTEKLPALIEALQAL
jgi:hypothetical protein